jgi:hypothetical protein
MTLREGLRSAAACRRFEGGAKAPHSKGLIRFRLRLPGARRGRTAGKRTLMACSLLFGLGCAGHPSVPAYDGFANSQRVTIRGYSGDAMEPFITRDGRYLLFNNSNDPSANTDLHYAERIDDLTFQYKGEITGTNSPSLDAVATMDRAGNFYFISTRSYATTLSTAYRARFSNGAVSGIGLLEGISEKQPGRVTFDVEVSPDGSTLYLSDGTFRGEPVPASADLAIAERRGAEFRRSDRDGEILRNINSVALEYAASISSNGLELFFTRIDNNQPAIYRAARSNADAPFEPPARITAIDGFAEASSLSPDERSLYYHKREGRQFVIARVTRK